MGFGGGGLGKGARIKAAMDYFKLNLQSEMPGEEAEDPGYYRQSNVMSRSYTVDDASTSWAGFVQTVMTFATALVVGAAILLTLLVPALVVGLMVGTFNAIYIERGSEKRKRH